MEEEKTLKKRKPRIVCDDRVKLYPDGKYHWAYEFHLLKNPTVLGDVYKVLGMAVIITAILIFLIGAFADGLDWESLIFFFKLVGIMAGIFAVLGILGYLLYAALNGWKYVINFTMDENGVEYKVSNKAAKKAKTIGGITALLGLLSGRPGVIGAGLLSASHTSLSSDFDTVKQVVGKRRWNLIKVNEKFEKNRVYAKDEDYDFVYDFICSHCKNATIK